MPRTKVQLQFRVLFPHNAAQAFLLSVFWPLHPHFEGVLALWQRTSRPC